jgi:2-phosphosulfolactate phosphatase
VTGELEAIDVGWGPDGLSDLAARCDALVVVDVLRFTTAVDVAVARGAEVYPYRWHDGRRRSAASFAAEMGAELAVDGGHVDDERPWSLSPVRLSVIPAGTRLVLPSPNGAALALGARDTGAPAVAAGCLRNAPGVGAWARRLGGRVGVLAAGERWRGAAGPLRPAIEDWIGAGAVVSAADPSGAVSSPDAVAAASSFLAARARLRWMLTESASGRELVSRGWDDDVAMAAEHGVSECVPVLDGARFVDVRFGDEQGPSSHMGE